MISTTITVRRGSSISTPALQAPRSLSVPHLPTRTDTVVIVPGEIPRAVGRCLASSQNSMVNKILFDFKCMRSSNLPPPRPPRRISRSIRRARPNVVLTVEHLAAHCLSYPYPSHKRTPFALVNCCVILKLFFRQSVFGSTRLVRQDSFVTTPSARRQ